MTLVKEKIPEKDRGRLSAFNLKNPVTGKELEPRRWTIDRERDIVLIGLGGQGSYHSEIPMFYGLIWKNNLVVMETFSKAEGTLETGMEFWWKITEIRAPLTLQEYNDEMLEIIKEAFIAQKTSDIKGCPTTVNFDLIATPGFVKEAQ